MSQIAHQLEKTKADQRWLLILVPLVAGLLALLASLQPMWTVLGITAVVVVFAVGKWPEASTMVVIFVLYSNAAAIGVEFHGLPFIVGSSFVGLLFVPFLYHVAVKHEKVIFPRTLQLLVLFVLVQLIGAIGSRHPDLALLEVFGSLTEGVFVYAMIINVVRTSATLRRAIWILIAAAALVSLAPIYQQLTGRYDTNLGGFGQVSNAAFDTVVGSQFGPVQRRLAGSIGEQNRFAQIMLMIVPLALFRMWGERSRHLQYLAGISACLITTAVVLTFSRGAAVGIVAIVLALANMRYVRPRHLAVVILGLAGVLIAFPQYGTRLAKLQRVWSLMDSEGISQGDADGSTKSRLTEMGAAGLAFLDHPFIGVGPGMFRFHYREYAEQIGLKVLAKGRGAHSLYPGLAAESGMAGMFLFTAIMLIALRDLVATRKRTMLSDPDQSNMAASFILVIIAYLTTAMFLHLAYVRFLWLLMALAFVASRVGRENIGVAIANPGPQVSP